MKHAKKRVVAFGLALLMVLSTVITGLPTTTAYAAGSVSLTKTGGWFETAYVEWSSVSGANSYKVYVKQASASDSTYVQLDDELIRKYPSYWRADALGLKAGSYILKIEALKDGSVVASSATSAITVTAHDRSGFGWVSGTASGAYNEDGTLRSGAVVLYVTEGTKDVISMDVVTNAKGATTNAVGIQNILNLYKKGYDSRPLAIRFIGQVTDFATMEGGDFVISGSSATKRINCGITVEGVGEDATCDGYGVRLKNVSNVEVRNLGFMNCNSSEGDNVGLQQDCDHVWVHNCDMFYGHAGSDRDQVKGDGALDCKKSTYVTFSYNHFFDNGKCNLLGLSEGTTEGLYITYHHNWYDHSDSRHPRCRYYSAHVYNNYYDGNAKYGVGSTLGSSVFVEANYFRNCPYPILTSMQGSDVFSGGTKRDVTNNATFSKEAGGTVKAFNNIMTGSYTFIPYGSSTYTLKGNSQSYNLSGTASTADFDAVVVTNKSTKVDSSIKSYTGGNTYNNFDTSSTMYSYKADAPADIPTIVTSRAGRINGGDFKWTFSGADDASYSVNQPLKDAITAYKTTLVSIGGTDSGAGSGSGSSSIALKSISLNQTSANLTVGGTVALMVSYNPSNTTADKTVTWSSSNTSVATVAGGTVTAKANGTATITAKVGSATAVCNVTVSSPVGITGIELDETAVSIDMGDTHTLAVSALPANATEQLGTVTWSSSNTSVATVKNGAITAVAAGTATITASYNGKKATCTVTVNKVEVSAGEYQHNFTSMDKDSTFYTITGNLSDSKGTVSYSGLTLTQCLKMESSTKISFVAPADGKLTLVFGGTTAASGKAVNVDGKAYTANASGIATVDVKAGAVEVTKKDAINLFFMEYVPSGSGSAHTHSYASTVTKVATCIATGVRTYTCSCGDSYTEDIPMTGHIYSSTYTVDKEPTATAEGSQSRHCTTAGCTEKTDVQAIPATGSSSGSGSTTPSGSGNFVLVGGANETIYAQLSGVSDAQVTGVSYSGTMSGSLKGDDLKYLVRDVSGGVRIDIPGIKAGTYTLTVTTSAGTYSQSGITVDAYDRSGFAHFNYTAGVGAYRDDGTLKPNAIVLYVTDDNKNTVSVTSKDGTTVTGIGNILNSAGQESSGGKASNGGAANSNKGIIKKLAEDGTPLVVRIVGTVRNLTDTSNPGSKALINGLTVYDSVDNGGTVGDNGGMARIKSGKDITIEGIGSDAVVDGWGFHFMAESSAPELGKSFELRNIIFRNTPEDAVGMEGVQVSANVNSELSASVERCWIHNNEFYGPNFTTAAESDKKEGDGSCDFKRGQYLTVSYNYFEGCHKTNLVGSSDTSLQYNLTYHHNFWYLCKARGPLARNANIHMYNNVFYGQTDYAMNTRANAYIFSEYNEFFMAKSPMRVDSGAIKSYNDSFASYINYMGGTIVTSKSQTVSNSCKFAAKGIDYSKFDTDSKLSYIPSGSYQLQESVTEAKKVIDAKTGVLNSGVTTKRPYLLSGSQIKEVTGNTTLISSSTKVSKVQYAFRLAAAADVTVSVADAVLINEAGEVKLKNSGTTRLEPGLYMLQSMNIQAGDAKTLTQGSFKDMTISSLVISNYDTSYDPNKLQSISLSETAKTLATGDKFELRVSYIPSTATDKTVTWTSSNASVATVAGGVVTAVGNGSATITASCSGKTATCKVTVAAPASLTGIVLDKTTATVTTGSTLKLEVSAVPSSASSSLGTVTWSSSNPSVATVSVGTVSAVSAGTVTITAQSGSYTATCVVTVQNAAGFPADDMVYNVTEKGAAGSSFYDVSGNVSSQNRTYNGLSLTKAIKMESSTSVSFNATGAGKLTMVFAADASKKVKIDGTSYNIPSDGVLTVDLAAGTHEIVKDTTNTYLFYLKYVLNQPSHVHSYNGGVVTKAATCMTTGVRTFTCNGCSADTVGHSYTEEIPMTEHTYAAEYSIDVAATAVMAGSKSRHCTTAGCTAKTDIAEIAPTGSTVTPSEMVTAVFDATTLTGKNSAEIAAGTLYGDGYIKADGTVVFKNRKDGNGNYTTEVISVEFANGDTDALMFKVDGTATMTVNVSSSNSGSGATVALLDASGKVIANEQNKSVVTGGSAAKDTLTYTLASGEYRLVSPRDSTNNKGLRVYDMKIVGNLVSYGAAHTHSYTMEVTKMATCIAKGERTYTCSCGASYVEEIAMTDHNYAGTFTIDKEATQTEAGSKSRHCTTPGCTAKTEVTSIPKTGSEATHTHSYTASVTKEPTCIAKGEKTYTCSCGASYTEEIEMTAHNYASTFMVDKAATETEAGSESRHCTTTGCTARTQVTTIPATGKPVVHEHSYAEEITKEPTCISEGIKTYTCSCGDSFTETLLKTNHTYASTFTVDKEATATEAGSKSRHCTTPGCTAKTQVTAIPATGTPVTHEHSYTATVTKAATCIATGVKTYTCSCGASYTEEIAMTEHTYAATFSIDKEATETAAGSKSKHCTTPGCTAKTEVTVIPATGVVHKHSYSAAVTKAATCIAAGVRTYTCSCGESYTEEIAMIDHAYATEFTVDVEATATEAGSKSRHCTTPGCTAKTEVTVIPATGSGNPTDSGKYLHNFTVSGTTSDVYTFKGGDLKGGTVIEYDGLTLKSVYDMRDNGDQISFTAPSAGTLKVVATANKKFSVTIGSKTSGISTNADGLLEAVVPGAGEVIVAKNNIAAVYLINFIPSETGSGTGHTHSYTSSVTKAATCMETGVKTYVCDCGESYTETIAKTNHDYAQSFTIDKEATATAAGSKSRHCLTEGCTAKTEVTVIPITETHQHNYVPSITKIPTCMEKGVRTYICSCGASYTEEIAKTPHVYAAGFTIDKVATATEAGIKSRHCETEGCTAKTEETMIFFEETPSTHEHNYTADVTKAATCMEPGLKTYVCSCGDKFTEELAKLNHNYAAEFTIDKAATATEAGSKSRHCLTEGCTAKIQVTVIPVSDVVPEHQHKYTSEVTKAATCIEKGVRTYTCSCGESYVEEIAMTAHDYSVGFTIDKEPTATTEGLKSRYCLTPGCTARTELTAIPATGEEHAHHYAVEVTKAATCMEKGLRTYTCSCGASYTEEIAMKDHDYALAFTVDKEPTKTETGLKSRHCLTPGCTSVTEVTKIPAGGAAVVEPENKEGLVFEKEFGAFLYYENNQWISDKYAFVSYKDERFLVANGIMASYMNGLSIDPQDKSVWYYVAEGRIVREYSGLALYDNEWFYVVDGKLDTQYSGFVNYDGGKFLVAAGRIVREAKGLVQDPNNPADWYYVADGQVVNYYTGLALYDEEWFYVINGRLAEDYTGNVTYNGEQFYVINGMYKPAAR